MSGLRRTQNWVLACVSAQTGSGSSLERFQTDGGWWTNERNRSPLPDQKVGFENRWKDSTDVRVSEGGAGKKLSVHLPHDELTGLPDC